MSLPSRSNQLNLVDPKKPHRWIVSLCEMPILGTVLWAYVVQTNEAGEPTLRSQRLLPENVASFDLPSEARFLDLITQLSEITPQQIFREFGGRIRNQESFFTRLDENPQRQFMRAYIDRHFQQALEWGSGLPLYKAARDGYPAGQKLHWAEKPADVHFLCTLNETELRYEAYIQMGGDIIRLHKPPVELVGEEQVYMVKGDAFVPVSAHIGRPRLSPFLQKEAIVIPAEKVGEFCRKVLPHLLDMPHLALEGMSVQTLTVEPKYTLRVVSEGEALHLRFRAVYEEWELIPAQDVESSVRLRNDPDGQLVRIERHRDKEQAKLEAFQKLLPPAAQSLFDHTFPKAEGLAWLSRNLAELPKLQIDVQTEGLALSLAPPKLEYQLNPHNGGYILQAQAWFSGQRVDFRVVADAIRKEEATLELPDGGTGLIPESWVESLLPLLETTERKPEGLFLQTVQVLLLQKDFPQEETLAQSFSLEKADPKDLPATLETELRPYQRFGYDWLRFLHKHRLGGILADEMGLGKTVQTIALLLKSFEEGNRRPSLVVAPSSLLFNWREEIERFAPSLSVVSYEGTKRSQLFPRIARSQVILTTYGVMRQDIDRLSEEVFHYIVLDESQNVKNPTTRVAQAIYRLQGEYRLALTGTPIENTTKDLWAQMHFLNPGLLGSLPFFRRYYADPIEKQHNETRAKRLREQVKPLILRRTKEMVAADLPEQKQIVLRCEMTPAQARIYNALKIQLRETLFEKGINGLDMNQPQGRMKVLTCLQQLRQAALHPALVEPDKTAESGKFLLLRDQLASVLAEGHRVLIFSQYVKLLHLLKVELEQKKIDFCYLDGSTKDRAQQVKRFQSEDGPPVFLISLLAGGTGLNLTAARYVFIFDPWWNPAVEQQAMARAHRIGQKHPVLCYKFITAGTIEEKILAMQQVKLQVAGEILPDEAAWMSQLTVADLVALFD